MKNRPLTSPLPVPPASQAQVDEFLKGLQQFRAKGDQPFVESEVKKYDEAGVKAYFDKMTVGSQQAIARRIMMDILKSSPSKDQLEPTRKQRSRSKDPTRRKKNPSKKHPSKKAGVKKRKPSKSR
jgi:hypothetical protein